MSSEHLVTVVVGSFDSPTGAEEALKKVHQDRSINVHDAFIIEHKDATTLEIKDTRHWGWVKGAVAGGVLGALVGIMVPPLGVALALGGATVGGVATARDHDISRQSLEALGQALAAGRSAVVLAVDPIDAEAAEKAIQTAGAVTVSEGLPREVVQTLAAVQDAYTGDQLPGATTTDYAQEVGLEDQARYQ